MKSSLLKKIYSCTFTQPLYIYIYKTKPKKDAFFVLEVYKDILLKIIVNLFYWKNGFLFSVLCFVFFFNRYIHNFLNKKIYDDEKYGIDEAFKTKLNTNQI